MFIILMEKMVCRSKFASGASLENLAIFFWKAFHTGLINVWSKQFEKMELLKFSFSYLCLFEIRKLLVAELALLRSMNLETWK